MKVILAFTAVLIFQYHSFASDSLIFKKLNYTQVLELAKKEKKPVMLFFHYDGCGACRQMERDVFTKKKVADFYNSNFICHEVNTRKGEGIRTNEIYKIEFQPTFIFLDEDGNIIHKLVGAFSPDEFLEKGQLAADPKNNLAYFNKQYQTKKNDPDFLYDYCYKLSEAYSLDSSVVYDYLKTQTEQDLASEKNIRLLFELAFTHSFKMNLTDREIYFMDQNRKKFYAYYDSTQVKTRVAMLYCSLLQQMVNRQDEAGFRRACAGMVEFDKEVEYEFKESDGRTTFMWLSNGRTIPYYKVLYYDKGNDRAAYDNALNDYLPMIWDNADDLNELAWYCYEHTNDKIKLGKALEFAERSIQLNSSDVNKDTYAQLYKKLQSSK